MIRNRIIYGVLWISSLVLISFYGGPISYGVFFLLTFIPLVSLFYLIYTYFFFHMYQKVDSKWLVVDDTSPFYFTLVNDYHILFAGIRVKFYADFSSISGLDERTEYEFAPKSGMTLETNLTCKCRGEYEVGIKTVVIEDYFRLLSLTYKNREPLKVVVRPKLVTLDSIESIDVSLSNKDSYSQDTEPDVLTRAYVPGDDLRNVHWGLTAKTGEIMIRQRTGLEQQGVGIILVNKRDGSKPVDYLPVENKMLETVLALSMYLTNKNIPVSHFHKGLEPVYKNLSKIEEFDSYYEMISGISFDSALDTDEFLKSVYLRSELLRSKTILVVTNNYSQAFIDMLSIYVSHNIDVTIYYIGHKMPDEFEAMNIARVKTVLVSPEAELREVI